MIPDSRSITRPTLLVDSDRVHRNIERMALKARTSGARFRPHFKTHQSAAVGEWFRRFGVNAITVSSVDMAEYFADHGWNDITIAFPVNWLQIDRLNRLADRATLGVLVESQATVARLKSRLTRGVEVWIDIDAGAHRTGLDCSDLESVEALAAAIAAGPHLHLRGLLTYAGNAYRARSSAEALTIYDDTVSKMELVRQALMRAGYSGLEISIGDTPTCSAAPHFRDVDEVRPGTMVFYDVQQWQMGACTEAEIAAVVACPIVASYPKRNELVIYGGSAHLSKDSIVLNDGTRCFGRIARLNTGSWSNSLTDAYVADLSQEVGIIRGGAALCEQFAVGQVLVVLPAHICLTVNELREYTTLEGEVIACLKHTAPSPSSGH